MNGVPEVERFEGLGILKVPVPKSLEKLMKFLILADVITFPIPTNHPK